MDPTPIVAIIEPVGGHGGMDYYDFGLANSISDAGHEVYLYTCDATAYAAGSKFTLKKPFKSIYGDTSKVIRGARYVKGLFKSCFDARRRRCSIVHLHFFHVGMMELFTITFAKLFGFKIALTVHDVESFSKQLPLVSPKLVFGFADALIVHNQTSLGELQKAVPSATRKMHVIHHGNYLDNLGAEPTREAACKNIGIDSSSRWILFFGQIKKVKGLDIVIRAMAQVKRSRPDVKLLIAGKMWRDSFSVYSDLISDLSLSDTIKYKIGYVRDSEVPNYYAAADIVVLPYKKIYQSGVLLMSMSYKRAVLVSDLPAMLEIVEPDVNGYVFESENPDSLAEKIVQITAHPDRLSAAAENAFNRIKTSHSWQSAGKATSSIYFEIADTATATG